MSNESLENFLSIVSEMDLKKSSKLRLKSIYDAKENGVSTDNLRIETVFNELGISKEYQNRLMPYLSSE